MHTIRIQDLKPIFYKQSLNIYMLLKNKLKAKKGPHFKTSLLEQIVLTLFKLKYSLPDRILESLFKRDKTAYTFSGYKHHHGLKYQCLVNEHKEIVSISHGIESSIHDKKIFEFCKSFFIFL